VTTPDSLGAGLTAAELRTLIAAAEQALIRGEASVSYEGRSITYRSVADLRTALGYARERLALLTSAEGTAPSGRSVMGFSRG